MNFRILRRMKLFVAINLLKGLYYIFLSVFGIRTYFERYIFFSHEMHKCFWNSLFSSSSQTIVYVYIATYFCFICNRKIYKFFTFQCILLWQIITWIVPSTVIALSIANQLFYKMREYFYWKKFNHAFENYEGNM